MMEDSMYLQIVIEYVITGVNSVLKYSYMDFKIDF